MNLTLLGHVDTEGGPLLLCDLNLAQDWHGVEHGGADYARACAYLDAHPDAEGGELPVGNGNALLWEMAGAGTAFVFRSAENELLIVRAWLLDVSASDEAILELATAPAKVAAEIGELRIESEGIIILWATDDGCEVSTQAGVRGDAFSESEANQSEAIVARMSAGNYRACHEGTSSDAGTVRRLRLTLQRQSTPC